jgi:hypothetical protein
VAELLEAPCVLGSGARVGRVGGGQHHHQTDDAFWVSARETVGAVEDAACSVKASRRLVHDEQGIAAGEKRYAVVDEWVGLEAERIAG